ncbi:MAG: phosphatidate cytidylyltransferase [Solirubrobacteraceae bacterium]|jgi:phosphatidate cytidylyltransferase
MAPARRPRGPRRASSATRHARARGRAAPVPGAQARREPRRESRREPRRSSELLARTLIAIPAALILILFVDLGGLAFALFITAIGLVTLHELYRLLARWRPLPLVGFASLVGMVLAARYGGQRQVMEVAVATVPVLFLCVLARGTSNNETVAIGGTLLGVYWVGLAFAHCELLRQAPHGNGVLLDVLVGTFLGDTGAYIGGRLFGRRPLAPAISPNKTVEGMFCGMFMAILAVFLAGVYQTWMTQSGALALGAAVAVLGPLGDLLESLVKRESGAKDAGTLFGAHGGALDRIDGVLFTVVAGYYIWLAVMH